MFLQWMWFSMCFAALVYASFSGEKSMMEAALAGCADAVDVTIRLSAGYLFFCGMMEIAKETGIAKLLERLMKPVLRRLMPHMGQAAEAVAVNLSMNMLGMGNAATPMGVEAMRQLEEESRHEPRVRKDMVMLLVLNATSLQLFPTTVISLRTAAGSSRPEDVLLPTMLCTFVTTLVGATLAKWMGKVDKRNE